MGSAVALRSDHTAIALRRLAKGYRDDRQMRRLPALAAVHGGMKGSAAARVGGMDRQMLRDRVHRFNACGPDGVTNAQGAGRPRSLNDERMVDLARIVETGPDLGSDGVVGWRHIGLVRVVAERFGVDCWERSMSDHLAGPGFSRISGRPRHPEQDGRVIEAFEETSPRRLQPTWPICLKGYLSQCGSRMRQGSARRTLRCASGHAREGAHACRPTSAMTRRTCSPPSAPPWQGGCAAQTRHASCPKPTPKPDTEAMQLHLDEITKRIARKAHAVVLMDRAGWHGTGRSIVPKNLTIILLPPKSPELNPVENVWQYLRANHLSNRVFSDCNAIVDAACDAWNALTDTPQTITSIGMRDRAHV